MRFGALFFSLLIPCALWATEEPAGCWKNAKVFPCAKMADQAGWVQRGELKLFLGEGSGVLLTGQGHWQILKGKVWLEKAQGWELSQLGREFSITGEAWIEKGPEKISIQQFRGETRVKGRFATVLTEGFQNWWTLAAEGILQPVPSSTLTKWNRWLKLPKPEAEEKIKTYSALWKDRIEESADLYQEIAQRRIASVEEKEESAHRREKRAQAERASMKKMFRDRYLNGL